MNSKRNRRSALHPHRWLSAVVFMGALPMPVALALGIYLITSDMTDGSGGLALSSQVMLFLTAVLVAGAGGFLIWRTVSSLGHPADADLETPPNAPEGAHEDGLEQGAPVMNSVARMLATIERQAREIVEFERRLDGATRELEVAKTRLREVSITDAVTGLYNRLFFSVRLEEEVSRFRRFGHPLSVVLVGVDGTGSGDAALESREGDETLRDVAQVLLKTSRNIDVICRYGDREFAVMLVETASNGARSYAARTRGALAASSFVRGRRVRASLGVASLPTDATTGDELLLAAEEVLHASRQTGTTGGVAAWTGWTVGEVAGSEARRT